MSASCAVALLQSCSVRLHCCGLGLLQTLVLKNCRGITDLGVSVLAARCKVLKDLSLHWCMAISDEALQVLTLNCTRLTSLDLAYAPVSRAGLGLRTPP